MFIYKGLPSYLLIHTISCFTDLLSTHLLSLAEVIPINQHSGEKALVISFAFSASKLLCMWPAVLHFFSKLSASCSGTVRCVKRLGVPYTRAFFLKLFIYPWLHCSNCMCLWCDCISHEEGYDTREIHCSRFRWKDYIVFTHCICPSS